MKETDSRILDHPDISGRLFYPRPEPTRPPPDGALDRDVETSDGTIIGTRLYSGAKDAPYILFFHGNGEIAADYDEIGPYFVRMGLSFHVADYRGYGRSTGHPTVSFMLEDAHAIFDHVCRWRNEMNYTGSLWIMGRSLGSASAVELAAEKAGEIQGLIIESGFAHTADLLFRLGIDTHALGIHEGNIFSNIDKIAFYSGPTLILHARDDQIIPVRHSSDLYNHSPAGIKERHIIENADHNTIMIVAGMSYFEKIRNFIRDARTT